MTATVVVGAARDVPAPANTDFAGLIRAVAALMQGRSSGLPNPGQSTGCSPLLRELLTLSGLAFIVSSEVVDDGQRCGHAGGNALDVAGIDGRLNLITDYLRRAPTLFAVAAAPDLFVWDGVLIPVESRDADMLAFMARCTEHVHLASSAARIRRALGASATTVLAALATPYAPPDYDTLLWQGTGTSSTGEQSLINEVAPMGVQRW